MTAPGPHNRSIPGNAPVTAQEASALDTWLESITSTSRRGGPVWPPVTGRSRRSANGHVDPETSLQATAEAFHARLTRAEHEAQPDVPADAIWEKIMATAPVTTPGAPRRAAELVSARASGQTARPPVRTIPAWLAGGHWAVSTLMIAAVVVGIVALYGSFAGSPGPNDDPATNPNFAMASPGETVTTPEPDIDRWLVDPSTIDCERDDVDVTTGHDPASDRPKPVENYLPFMSASNGDQQAIAERWQRITANCAPKENDPVISDDFGWMPGVNGGVIPTLEQIAIAQEISDALPMQDYRDYYIIREPASGATPEANAGATGGPVLLPEDIIQLPDGRVGGPVRIVIETDDPDFAITDFTKGYEAAGSVFVVFEQVDGRWLYDEMFLYCVGDCDWFWTEIADPDSTTVSTTHATPSANADWLAPYSPDECDVEPRTLDDVTAFMQDPGEWSPRQYGPVQPVSENLALAVASANRVFQSCSLTGEPQDWRAMVSPRLIFEGKGSPQFDSIINRSATYEEFVANHRQLSELLLTNPDDYTIESTQAQSVMEDGLPDYSTSEIYWSVMLPRDLVRLPDGRIGGPELQLLPANHDQIQEAIDAVRLATPAALEYQMVNFRIYVQDPTQNGQWVLDETLTLCASGCDAWYAVAEEFYQANVPIVPATPSAATPAGTPAAAASQPITPDECDVEALSPEQVSALTEDAGSATERSYVPTGPVNDALAGDIAAADRAWQSCYTYGSAGERAALQSPRLTRDGPDEPLGSETSREAMVANLDQFDATRDLADAMLTGSWQDYYVESDLMMEFAADPVTGVVEALPGFNPVFPIAEQALALADGRVAIPIAQLVPPGTYPYSLADVDDISVWWIQVHILVQEPALHGRWVVDETLYLCMGDCDQARAESVDYIAYLDSLAASPQATPEATPEATPAATPQARQELPFS